MMTFNADTLYGATRPTMHVPGHALLRQLNEEARGRALDAFTAALVRAEQLERRCAAVLVSPAAGLVEAAELARWLLASRLPVRMNLQLHRVVGLP